MTRRDLQTAQPQRRLTGAERGQVAGRLSELTEELELISSWLYEHGERRAVALIGDAASSLETGAWAVLRSAMSASERLRADSLSVDSWAGSGER